ncbi:MAG: OmpH family outer membrane protein [Betaproteobacteria bacterium]|jgi:outer membrane protein|nr:OmpH family outer membrane protein [Betaproteobacteria bacterium]NBY53167.1 OmpH family outer membrane protein [Betaproteobacteria bacterium]NCU94767.1 OmpH family outer membrane protein [Betaproteobacteria bacterium]NDF70505.1 OmpH family outer membrane protein [Betaproteobacteria bacterium]
MQRILISTVFVALTASLQPALAADAPAGAGLKVGVVDTERIMRESAPADRVKKKIEKEFAGRDQDLQKMAKQAKDMQTSLEKDGVTMSDSDRQAKERELAALTRELQRKDRELREDFNRRRNEELSGMLEQINKVIRKMAEAEKYDLILQDAVYRSPRIDVTDKVLKALGAEAK